PSQKTYLVASITLDSARSCVMQGAFLTQGTVPSIPTILSWGDSIRPKGFRPSILLLTLLLLLELHLLSNHALLSDPLASGLLIAPSSWSFVFAVPSQKTHLVASITLDSARSCVMQGAFLTQGTVPSIPTILSWGDSIRPKGFRPSILLLTVIIVTVAIVVAVVLVIVDTIIGIVVVVVGAPSIIKPRFII
nr:hypothetical protein [Tanacetum cinerariifolium]